MAASRVRPSARAPNTFSQVPSFLGISSAFIRRGTHTSWRFGKPKSSGMTPTISACSPFTFTV